MIRKLQIRFIMTAGFALLVVLASVVGVINGAMRVILEAQTLRVLNRLAYWDGSTDGEERQGPEPGTMLGNHYFRALLDGDGTVIALDLAYSVTLDEEQAAAIAALAFAGGREKGRILSEDRLYAYRVSAHDEDGGTSMVFLDYTPTVNTIDELFRVSLHISGLSLVSFLLILSLLSRQAVRPLLRNIESQKRFITNAGHELKTPLAIISANTELLEALNGENEWTRSIDGQVRRMTKLVGELVTLSKISELERPELKAVDLSRLASEAADAIAPVVRRQGKTLERELPGGICAEGDERLLRMLADILLDNAAKYCDAGGVIRLRLAARSGAGTVTLAVSNDYAAGKDVDFTRFFERFYQEDQSHNSGNSGFGIGLSTAQEITACMKGSIRAEWQDGRIEFRALLRRGRPARKAEPA